MFRLIRFILFIGIAFLAGILYERSGNVEECRELGGNFLNGICER